MCCLAHNPAPPVVPGAPQMGPGATARTSPQAVRAQAFRRLVAFGTKRAFRTCLAAACDEIWGPEFAQRDVAAQRAAYERPEAEGGCVTYCLLDAPTADGTTIAEQFLAQRTPARTLPPAERDYLQRLAATRMGLYRIDAVHVDRGLTCTDLWTNERIDVRERKLTHDVKPASVIGARTFPAIDGKTELDGAIYLFSEPQAWAIVESLRTEWNAVDAKDAALDEERFLKRRLPVLIHRGWFDDNFFSGDERLGHTFGVGIAEPPHVARTAELAHFRFADPELRELAAFLHSSAAPTAMTIDRLHGYLTAVNCAPKLIRPQVWLPPISGEAPMRIQSQEQGASIVEAVEALSKTIARHLRAGTFEPLLPSSPPADMEHIAQGWCIGFIEGMALQQRSWDALMNDTRSQMMIMPIFMLVDPSAFVEDATPDPAATADIVKLLPSVVAMIFDYFADKRSTRATARALERKRGTSTTAGSSFTTVHRLKITLDGVRPPIWRRVEIPSNAQLSFVSRVLLAAMGWTDSHLHAFRVGSVAYGTPDPDVPGGMRSEHSVTLAQIAPRARDRFFLDYDFGDGWEHRVVVESIEPARERDPVRCLDGGRACPPEDCGGVGGYRDLLRIVADPTDPEHGRMHAWVGDGFDPAFFDIAEVNAELQRLGPSRRARSRRSKA